MLGSRVAMLRFYWNFLWGWGQLRITSHVCEERLSSLCPVTALRQLNGEEVKGVVEIVNVIGQLLKVLNG